jgi:hypothetical protein
VTGFNAGVILAGGGGYVLADLQANGNGTQGGISLTGSIPSIVTRCTADSNQGNGFMLFTATISDSVVSNNGGGVSATDSTLIHNVMRGNGGNGLSATRSVFGSNLMVDNGVNDVVSITGSLSQNNNLCTNGPC